MESEKDLTQTEDAELQCQKEPEAQTPKEQETQESGSSSPDATPQAEESNKIDPSPAESKVVTEKVTEQPKLKETDASSMNEIKKDAISPETDLTNKEKDQQINNGDEEMKTVENEAPLVEPVPSAAIPLASEEQTATNSSQVDVSALATDAIPEIAENSEESTCLDGSVAKEAESCDLTNHGEQVAANNTEERGNEEVANLNEDSMAMDESQIKTESQQPATTPKTVKKKTKTSTPSSK